MASSIFIIRDSWAKISPKTQFILKLFKENSDNKFYYIIRDEKERFLEKWDNNQIYLATSTTGVFFYYFSIMFRSPRDFIDRISTKILKKNVPQTLITTGFITVLSKTLNHFFASSARSKKVMKFIEKINSKKIFLIDEFISIRTLNVKLLKKMGSIIYVSQDIASDNFNFYPNFISRRLMYKLEKNILENADLVIACSERDMLKYTNMGAKKAFFYPNIYPIKEFMPSIKDDLPSISIAFQSRWGDKNREFYDILKSLSRINRKIKIYVFGMNPQTAAYKNIEYFPFIANKTDFMKILSKSWIGINIGIHHAGSNERKYDYAMAGLVVFSDTLGCRGDLIAHEYTFLDCNDLVGKLEQILSLSKEKIFTMGAENREYSLSLAEKQRSLLSASIKDNISRSYC